MFDKLESFNLARETNKQSIWDDFSAFGISPRSECFDIEPIWFNVTSSARKEASSCMFNKILGLLPLRSIFTPQTRAQTLHDTVSSDTALTSDLSCPSLTIQSEATLITDDY